ncbi:MAG: CPBP family intramembrane metalloprotease [Thaumarchaeota archaeon]|nr:CPBP family intramembrane metalloprotease [Nitrososphaerota archaeon]MCL5317283.1 CPBP family intramembrane metalloprotease [Nitrososphaerota archaeon]
MQRYKVVLFYVFAFAISWTFWFLMSLTYHGSTTDYTVIALSSIAGLGPLLSLIILGRVTGNAVDFKKIAATARFRGAAHKRWFLPATLAIPCFTVLGVLLSFLLGLENAGDGQLRLIKSGPDTLGLLVLPIMAVYLFASLPTSPLFEEPGWRGFALPKLQRRFGREGGSIIVGFLWWVWHQPSNLTFGIEPTAYAFLQMVTVSFMIDSLFNLSGENLLTAMLAHASSGVVFTFLYEGSQTLFALIPLVGFVAILRIRVEEDSSSF